MKRKIFLLGGILYFFVLQIFVIGYLWSDSIFYTLGFINIGVLFLLVFGYMIFSLRSSIQSASFSIKKNIFSPIMYFCRHYGFVISIFLLLLAVIDITFFHISPINIVWFMGIFVFFFLTVITSFFHRRVYIGKQLFLPKSFLVWLSLILSLLVYHFVDIPSIFLSVKIFFSAFSGFVVFVLGIWAFKAIGAYSVWKLIITRVYLMIIFCCLLVFGPQWYLNIYQDQMIQGHDQLWSFALEGILENYGKIHTKLFGPSFIVTGDIKTKTGSFVISGGEELVFGENYYESTGYLISTGIGSTTGIHMNLEENFEEEIVVDEISDDFFPEMSDTQILTYAQALKYIIDSNKIPLSIAQNTKFAYISKKNEMYPYFKTAIESSLIGKKQKPDLSIRCDNYIVIKGILEKRNVSGYKGDVFEKYFQRAKDIGILNGCARGKYLTKINL